MISCLREFWIQSRHSDQLGGRIKLTTKAAGHHREALAQEAHDGFLFHEECHSVYGKGP